MRVKITVIADDLKYVPFEQEMTEDEIQDYLMSIAEHGFLFENSSRISLWYPPHRINEVWVYRDKVEEGYDG